MSASENARQTNGRFKIRIRAMIKIRIALFLLLAAYAYNQHSIKIENAAICHDDAQCIERLDRATR